MKMETGYYSAAFVWGCVGGLFDLPISWVVLGLIVISLIALWLMGDLQIGRSLEADEVE